MLWIDSVFQQAIALLKEHYLRCKKEARMGLELFGAIVSTKLKLDSNKVLCKVFAVSEDMVKSFNRPDMYTFF